MQDGQPQRERTVTRTAAPAADTSFKRSAGGEAIEGRPNCLALAGAARLLGVFRYGLTLKMQRLGIEE